MKPKRPVFYSLLIVGGLALASHCIADNQAAPPTPDQTSAPAPPPPPAETPAPAPAPAPHKSLFGSLFQINVGQTPPPPPAPVVVAPAPAPVVVAPVVVPESYVWDGYEYVGFVGGQYVYLGPGNAWVPLESYRLERWYDYERYHPDWRAHMIRREIHDEHLQEHANHLEEKDATRLQEQKQKDAAHLQQQDQKLQQRQETRDKKKHD